MEGEAAVEEDEGFHTVTAGNWSVFMYILILDKKISILKMGSVKQLDLFEDQYLS